MFWWLTTAMAAGLTPQVTVDWSPAGSVLEVVPPLGIEVAEDAPASVRLSWSDEQVHWQANGAALADGVAFGAPRGAHVRGQVQLSLCDKADGTCVPRAFDLDGVLGDPRRGTAVFDVVGSTVAPTTVPVAESPAHDSPWQADAAAQVAAAFAAAQADGKRVILDFSAVWCPPCNLLAAEVLHAEPRPAILDDYHLVVLDADDASSFETKSRYQVGGYPTVVIADASGAEISRQVGYPGVDEMVEWLTRAASQGTPDTDLAGVDPTTVDAAQAAEIAWMLWTSGNREVADWVEAGAAATDTAALHLARVGLDPNLDDARWLADHAPGRAEEWVYNARSLAEEEEGRAVLRRALEQDLRGASGAEASDLLYLLAEVAHEEDAPLLYGAAAAALRSDFTGDPERDRGHYTWLSVLAERSGDVDGALQILEEAQVRWPDEPTFSSARARALLRLDRPADALVAVDEALAVSWGDNRLRIAADRCEALVALGRAEEAMSYAAQLLVEIPAPASDLEVRSGRYRAKLQAFVDGEATE